MGVKSHQKNPSERICDLLIERSGDLERGRVKSKKKLRRKGKKTQRARSKKNLK